LFLDSGGIINYCAPAIKKIVGYTPDELINKHISVLDSHVMKSTINLNFKGILTDGIVQSKECEFKTKENRKHWVEVSVNNQISTEFLNVIVLNIRDIQERREHEMEIERLLTFQSTILDNAGSAIMSTTPEGIITSFNKTAEDLLGYQADELIGKRTPECFHLQEEIEAQAKYLSEKMQLSIDPGFEVFTIEAQIGTPSHYQWTYKRKNGSLFPVNLVVTSLKNQLGDITGYIGITMDMSGIKSAEEKFSYFYNLSPDMAGISRMSDGLFVDVNNSFLSSLGYSYYDVVGKTSA
jgi:PAS domain S-box-containing protein